MKRLVLAFFLSALIPVTVTARPYFPTPKYKLVLGVTSINVPVLLYHYVRELPSNDPLGASLSVTPSAFKQQLTFLIEQGYTPISLQQFSQALLEGQALPAKPILLTFDDGTADVATTVFPILRAYGVPATIFVVSGFVDTAGYISWAQLRMLSRSPLISIGSHGLNHSSLTALDSGVADRQLTLSRNYLRAAIGQNVQAVAYPNGAFTSRTLNGAARARYALGFTSQRGTVHSSDRPFELPRLRAGGSVRSLEQALTHN